MSIPCMYDQSVNIGGSDISSISGISIDLVQDVPGMQTISV